MADDMPEVIVGGQTNPVIKKPPSAWKVGLLFSLISGPVGGLAAGLIQRHRNKSYLEREAAAEDEKTALTNSINKEFSIADDDEKRLLELARSNKAIGYERLAAGDTQAGEQLIAHSRDLVEQVIKGDISQRKG